MYRYHTSDHLYYWREGCVFVCVCVYVWCVCIHVRILQEFESLIRINKEITIYTIDHTPSRVLTHDLLVYEGRF